MAGVLNGRSYRELAGGLAGTVKVIDGALRRGGPQARRRGRAGRGAGCGSATIGVR
ncbi:MAG: hypothetical protein JO168_22490 [Solirubrobacterales bacterium]|nr:hypothetical protein [Solirubrobacterales bacterium]